MRVATFSSLIAALVLVSVFWSGACLAGDGGPAAPAAGAAQRGGEAARSRDFPDGLKVQLRGQGTTQSRIKGQDGKYSVYEAEASVSYQLMEQLSVKAEYQHSHFDWQNPDQAGFGSIQGDPWTNLNRASLGGAYKDRLGERWFYAVRAVATSAFEEELDGSFGGGGGGMVGYALTQNLEAGAGVMVFANAIRVRPIPALFLRYKPDWGLEASVGSQGLSVGYHFADWLFVNLAGNRNTRFHRLSDHSPVEKKGYVEISDWHGGLFADVDVTDSLALTAGLTYLFKREIKIYDKDGDRRYERLRVKPGYGGHLGLTCKF